MKKLAVIGLMAMSTLIASNAMQRTYSMDEIYSTTTLVHDVDYETDTVTIRTFSGIEYQFTGCEDWFEGDICSVIMDKNGTPEVYDDIILQTRYAGWVEEDKNLWK